MKQTKTPKLLKLEEVEAPFWYGGLWAKPVLASPAPSGVM